MPTIKQNTPRNDTANAIDMIRIFFIMFLLARPCRTYLTAYNGKKEAVSRSSYGFMNTAENVPVQ